MPESMLRWRRRVRAALRSDQADRGVSALEYVGMVIIVAGIIIAIRGLGLDGKIAGALSAWVTSVIG